MFSTLDGFVRNVVLYSACFFSDLATCARRYGADIACLRDDIMDKTVATHYWEGAFKFITLHFHQTDEVPDIFHLCDSCYISISTAMSPIVY